MTNDQHGMDASLRSAGLGVAFDDCRGAADRVATRVAGVVGMVGTEGGGAGAGVGAGGGDFCVWNAVADGAGVGGVRCVLWFVPDRVDCAGGDLSLQPDGAERAV